MPVTEKEVLTGFLSTTLNLDEAGVASLYKEDGAELKDDALEILKKLDVERVAKLKPDTKKIQDDFYKKGQSESLSKLEKEFKEKVGFESDKKGIDLFIDYAVEKAKATGDITEDVIKKHPAYIGATEKLKKEMLDAVTAKENEFNQFKTGLEKKETFSKVASAAVVEFNKLKPILSKDPARAKAQEELFAEKLNQFEYQIQESGLIVVLKDGKVYEDGHGNRIPLAKVVKDITDRYFDVHITDPKSSAGNGKDKPEGQAATFNLEVPKTEAEYNTFIANSSIPLDKRLAMKSLWEAKQKTS